MAQAIMSQAGTGNANMRMGIIYTVGTGYVQITGMYGCRYDSYNTSGSPCTVYTNGGNAINISAAHGTSVGTFRANSSKNTTLTNTSYWRAWGAGPTIYTSASSITLTFTFACSATSNIANSKFSTTVTGIPQPYAPKVGDPVATNITRTTATLSCTVSDAGRSTIDDSGIYYYKGGAYAGAVDDTDGSISGNISGLTPNTVYAMNGWAHNKAGYYGYSRSNVTQYDQTQLPSFTTSGNAPSISWGGMVTVGRKYAVGSWHVTYDTNASFGSISANQYGTTTSYGSNAEWGWDGTHNAIYYGGNSEANGTLQPNTTYYYKFQQKDSWGRASNTLTGSFTTSGNPPTITNFKAINIGAKEAKLTWSDSYDTNARYSTYSIEYGTTTAYGTTLNAQSQLSDLDPRTTYYVRLTLKDNWGRTSTATTSFTTLAGDATGYVKGYVDGKGVVWQRGTVYIKQERRNMLNTEVITKTINGVTMSYDAVNHAIVLNGTCTADNTCLNLDKQVPLLLDGDYTISFEELGGTATNKDKVRLQMQNNSTWYGIWVHCNNKAGYETKYLGDTLVNANNIRVDAGVVLDNYKVRFQLEKGKERTEFEPYEPHWKKGRRVRKKTGGVWSESD